MASDLFRTAFNGFNRTDVVQFIQKQTSEHEKNLRVLRDENRQLKQGLSEAKSDRDALADEKRGLEDELAALREKLAAAEQKNAELTELVESVTHSKTPVLDRPMATDVTMSNSFDEMELTAYRRAELTERMARERAQASADRMKQILSQGFEKISTLEGDYALLSDVCRNDFARMQELLQNAREILNESSDGLRAAQALCESI